MSQNKRAHWIKEDMYDWFVLIYVGSWNEFSRYMNRRFKFDIGEQTHGGGLHMRMSHDSEIGTDFSVVWMPSFNIGNMVDVRILSHELLHAAMHMLHCCGIEFDYDNQESICYSHEHLNKLAHKELWK